MERLCSSLLPTSGPATFWSLGHGSPQLVFLIWPVLIKRDILYILAIFWSFSVLKNQQKNHCSHGKSGPKLVTLHDSHQAIRATTGTAFSPFGTYSVELKDTSAPWKPVTWHKWGRAKVLRCFLRWEPHELFQMIVWWSIWWNFSVFFFEHQCETSFQEDIMLRVCTMGSYGKHNAIMIGSAGAVKTIWAYVHMGSWSVYGSISNPGRVKPSPTCLDILILTGKKADTNVEIWWLWYPEKCYWWWTRLFFLWCQNAMENMILSERSHQTRWSEPRRRRWMVTQSTTSVRGTSALLNIKKQWNKKVMQKN